MDIETVTVANTNVKLSDGFLQQQTSLVDLALVLSKSLGIAVFPCKGDKSPACEHGHNDALKDEAGIRALFEAAPNAKYVGGKMGDGLFVLDVDLYNDHEALADWMISLGIDVVDTFSVATQRGGRHFYFKGDRNSSKPRDYVDLKGAGGYVILPNGLDYTIIDDSKPAFLPELLARELNKRKDEQSSETLDDLKRNILLANTFHDSLTRLAAKLYGRGLSEAQVTKEVLDLLNNSAAAHPLHKRHERWLGLMSDEKGEVARILKSGNTKYNSAGVSENLYETIKANPVLAAVAAAMFDSLPVGEPPEITEKDVLDGLILIDEVDEAPDVTYLVDGLIEEGCFFEIIGAYKSGKSFFASYLAMCIGTGTPFFGLDVEQGSVCYIGMESPKGITRRFQAAQIKGFGGSKTNITQYVKPVNALADPVVFRKTLELLKEHTEKQTGLPCRMIVIDTFRRAIQGYNENSQQDTGAATGVMLEAAKEMNVAVCFCHHTGHGNNGRGSGSTNIEANVEGCFLVEQRGDAREVYTRIWRESDVDEDTAFARFKLDTHVFGQNKRGQDITAAYVVPLPVGEEEGRPTGPTGSQARFVYDTIGKLSAKHALVTKEMLWQEVYAYIVLEESRGKIVGAEFAQGDKATKKKAQIWVNKALKLLIGKWIIEDGTNYYRKDLKGASDEFSAARERHFPTGRGTIR